MDALRRWSEDEFRSMNSQIEMVLQRALKEAGRLPEKEKSPIEKSPIEKSPSPISAADSSDKTDAPKEQ